MAEICVGSTEVCEPSTRAARRRRMDIRRFKLVAGAESMASSDELRRKNKVQNESDKSSDNESSSDSDPEHDQDQVSAAGSGEFGLRPRYGMTSVRGRRRDMEDAVSIRPDFLKTDRKHHFYGVFDGHGCSHVAASCGDRMHEVVAAEVSKHPGSSPDNWKEIMEKGFARMEAEAVENPGGTADSNCRCELQTPKCDHVGSTAVVAVVSSDRIVVANCGDSRAVLGRKGAAVPLSVDHKPDRPDELQRIEDAGGRVIYWDGARVLGVLAMSRAIGDGYLKPFVISEPEVTVTERTDDDECLVLASDGLWDVVSNKTACDVVRMCLRGNTLAGEGGGGRDSDKACSDAAMLLTKLALARQSADNVSVVVVDLRRNL